MQEWIQDERQTRTFETIEDALQEAGLAETKRRIEGIRAHVADDLLEEKYEDIFSFKFTRAFKFFKKSFDCTIFYSMSYNAITCARDENAIFL